jgi:hypothetical protein
MSKSSSGLSMLQKWFVAGAFVLPLVVILLLVVTRKKTENSRMLTKSALTQMEAAWARHKYTPISTNSEFNAQLENVPIRENGVPLESADRSALREALRKIVFSNYGGDYAAYRAFRTPGAFDPISTEVRERTVEWFQDEFPGKAVPSDFETLDRSLYDVYFKGTKYWKAIALEDARVILLRTNSIPPGGFKVEHLDTPVNCVTITVQPTYSFSDRLRQILEKDRQFTVASVTLLIDAVDPKKCPRPFLYCLVLDPQNAQWLPVQLTHCSTRNYDITPAF